jgi:DNA-binding MarR family transcriptional regulator
LHKDWQATEQVWISPGDRGENLRFNDFPALQLMSLAGLVKHSLVRNYLEPWGLAMPEWRLVCTVAEQSPIPFARIARLTAMDKAQVSRALRTAQGKGYVESGVIPVARRAPGSQARSPASKVQVSITAAGRELHEQIMPLVQRDQLRFIELMSRDDRRAMLTLMQRIGTLLQGEPGHDVTAPRYEAAPLPAAPGG